MDKLIVTCAIIKRKGKIFAAQRSKKMSLPLKWEFPGGKVNNGENLKECLMRELFEGLNIEVAIGRSLPPVTHQYKTFEVTLYPFICTIVSGEISLHEHAAIAWLSPDEMYSLDWAEADLPVIKSYLQEIRDKTGNLI